MNRAQYHEDWSSISRQIREQAGNVCEFCGVPNGERGKRDARGQWHSEASIMARPVAERDHGFGGWRPTVTIVLTVAHLCHDTTCYDPTHLRALCQYHHLQLDRDENIRKARETRHRKRINSGQMVMWVVE